MGLLCECWSHNSVHSSDEAVLFSQTVMLEEDTRQLSERKRTLLFTAHQKKNEHQNVCINSPCLQVPHG